ncbi:MAG TPA: M55 family metallopeptidase [Azospirillaceae bacterium]|nr:M55 family metallopeptidase [Azospirillaceae bacterium]
MRLHISADIEGIAGVTSRDHLMPSGFEYEPARRWMTETVAAVAEEAHALGVEQVVVADSHGNAQNLQMDRLPDYVQVVRGWPRRLGMMQGIDEGPYVGSVMLGYHAGAGSRDGGLAHTLSGRLIREVWINGRVASEAYLNAAVAGHFDVPVLLVSGDDAFVAECREQVGDVVGATVKWSQGRQSTRTLTPAAACALIRSRFQEAFQSRATRPCLTVPGPIRLEVEFKTQLHPEVLSYLPAVERTGSHRITVTAASILEATRFLMFVVMYNPSE